jgi:hypothetical protein
MWHSSGKDSSDTESLICNGRLRVAALPSNLISGSPRSLCSAALVSGGQRNALGRLDAEQLEAVADGHDDAEAELGVAFDQKRVPHPCV